MWSYIFNKKKLQSIIDIEDKYAFNELVDKEFTNKTAIGTLIYYHNPAGTRKIKNFVYSDIKRNEYYKNLIYVGGGCAGLFNGYVSWLKNIGRCFSKKYQITILYDTMEPTVLKYLTKYCRCVRRETDMNYYTDRLLVTYSK